MMPLFVNARFLTQQVTGTQRFAVNIARELKRLRPETIFLAPPAIMNQDAASELGVEIIGARSYRLYQKLNLPANLLWEQIDLPLHLARRGRPRLLNLVNTAPYFYQNNLVTIHDLAFRLFPEFFSRQFAALYNLLLPRLARRARQVITVSRHSKQDIRSYFKIPPDKITVVYNAVDPGQKARDNDSSPYPWPYILAAGAKDPRKNVARLIAAFLELSDTDLRLVIVGNGDHRVFSESPPHAENKLTDRNPDKVIFTGYIEDRQLTSLYRHAVCFCYPSLYEGFGLPPLEAQAQGCPVIVSNRASLPEVFGDSALYCDPEKISDINEKLRIIIMDEELRSRLKQKGLGNCRRFSWRESAERILAIE
ncbi:MAG: glycosyltransferase family 4 protein [Deltaproteobacteria bacterium]|nr:glycosyltransferase family 4 protein [Deltaproteobacteria bacterium]